MDLNIEGKLEPTLMAEIGPLSLMLTGGRSCVSYLAGAKADRVIIESLEGPSEVEPLWASLRGAI